MTGILSVDRLSIGFEQPHQTLMAVEDLSLELNPGETLALLGESGCGKSITSLALMRLLPHDGAYARFSQIHFDQHALLDLPEHIMRTLRGKRIAMIFQEPMTALNPVLTIGQQLAESLSKAQRSTSKVLRDRMIQLLKEVEIPEPEQRLEQYPHQLSGGQKQRIVIAMALASHPDVLIADEPTTALDATTQAQILRLLKQLQHRYQMSILLITHDLNVVKMAAHRVCVMYAGQLVECATVSDFMNQPKHPYVQQLQASLPSFSKRGEKLQAITGSVPTLESRPTGCRFHPRCVHVFERCKHEMPQLQTLSTDQQVRCHLYPRSDALPPLPISNEKWGGEAHQDNVILSVHELKVYFYPKRRLFSKKRSPFKAVDGVSFSLKEGKTLALVGESGSGKTTVCRALLRLQSITEGRILYRDQDIESLRGRDLKGFRKNVQIIFQDPFSSMNPRMTIADILAEGMLAQGMSNAKIKQRQLSLLDHVNLPQNSLTRYPHQFSGGQRQRICIARALATDPRIIVCDEPTSALDISVQAQILNLLKSLQHTFGLSYLFITHNMDVVSYMADDVLVMRDGKTVEFGPCEDVLRSPQAMYTKMLLNSSKSEIPALNFKRGNS